MLASANGGIGVGNFQNEVSMKNTIYSVSNAWKRVTKEPVVHSWHNLWLATKFNVDDEQDGDCERCYMLSEEKKMMSYFLKYTKNIPSESNKHS